MCMTLRKKEKQSRAVTVSSPGGDLEQVAGEDANRPGRAKQIVRVYWLRTL